MPAVSNVWKNWSGNQEQTSNVEVVKPKNLAQLKSEMDRAVASGKTVRPVGTAHAWAELIANDGKPLMVVDLSRWEGELIVDRSDDTATFPAGWRLDEVTKRLEAEGYLLNSPPVYEKMNIGGLLGTASHGTGDGQTETMSDHLIGFKMLKPDGTVLEINKEQTLTECEKELLRAVRCSMGALGIVFEVTLRVSPNFSVREHDYLVPVEEALDKLDDTIDSNMFVEMFWVPFSKDIWFKAYNRTNPVRRFRLSSIYYWLRDTGMYLFQLTVYPGLLKRRSPKDEQWRTRRFLTWLSRLLRVMMGDRIVPANKAFHFQKTVPKIIALAFVVRREQIVDLWRYLMGRVRDQEVLDLYPTNIMVESRFIRRSQDVHGRDDNPAGPNYSPATLLSPAVFDETAYIELVGFNETEGMLEFFQEVERGVMQHFCEARPHWGKYFTEGRDLARRYDKNEKRPHYRMARFQRVREHLDPDHVMSNEYLEREVFRSDMKIPTEPPREDLDKIRNCYPPPGEE